MTQRYPELKFYPSAKEVDAWLESILEESQEIMYDTELLYYNGFAPYFGVRHLNYFTYVRFLPEGMDPFYAYWQPAPSGPAPLLVHTPGYSANLSSQPDLVMQGFTVMHVSPLGYMTPFGPDESKRPNAYWPVLPDTVLSRGEKGYKQWLINCALAIDWARRQPEALPDRISFFGTSQGGGGSLLLASLYKDRGVRCAAADVPFLTNFPLASRLDSPSYSETFKLVASLDNEAAGWYALGLIDTLSHIHRLNLPVMLTAGSDDTSCPVSTIESLFAKLTATKMYCRLENQDHGHTKAFIPLAAAWFRLYA